MPVRVKFAEAFMHSAFLTLLAMSLVAVMIAAVGSTRVFLDPPSQTVNDIGDSLRANVSIADVSNLYGYEFELYYSSAVMKGTQIVEGSFLKNSGQTFFRVVNFTDHYNSTHGLASILSLLMGSVPGVSGSGVLATIKSRCLAVGDSVPLHLADTKLTDSSASQIPHQDFDGTVTVIPEFKLAFAFLLLVVASLFGIRAKKYATRRV